VATKLTIWIEDYPKDYDYDPIVQALYGLEEGFRVLHWDIDFNKEVKKKDEGDI
jgi:hypothetical protein